MLIKQLIKIFKNTSISTKYISISKNFFQYQNKSEVCNANLYKLGLVFTMSKKWNTLCLFYFFFCFA